MVIALPIEPTLKCDLEDAPMGVVVTFKNKLNPISSVNINLNLGYAPLAKDNNKATIKTDIKGLAQICVIVGRYVKLVSVQKSGINFGSGVGATHYINKSISGTSRGIKPYMFENIVAKTDIDSITTIIKPLDVPKITIPDAPIIIKPPDIPKPTCDILATEHATESIPNTMKPNMPFKIILTGITDYCKDKPADPSFRKLVEGVGVVKIGNLEGRFPVSNGRAELDLNNLFDLSTLTGGLSTPPKIITTEKTPTKIETKPTGRFGGSVAAASAYILRYYGAGYRVEPTSFGGGTAVKITRPNGSYFNAQSYGDIDRYINWRG